LDSPPPKNENDNISIKTKKNPNSSGSSAVNGTAVSSFNADNEMQVKDMSDISEESFQQIPKDRLKSSKMRDQERIKRIRGRIISLKDQLSGKIKQEMDDKSTSKRLRD
jgi:hypothetical protein